MFIGSFPFSYFIFKLSKIYPYSNGFFDTLFKKSASLQNIILG